ncbi:hypothetical protein BGY98DRAFT_651016 [Russula aff. rugulosa BPL654]|nr:hypothetical protein BGY98DRAFT_651016 [Russula aff. rugulosa BPL654]
MLVGSDYQETPRTSDIGQTLGAYSHRIGLSYTTGWRQSGLAQTRTVEHLFPDSLNLSNQPNPLPPTFPYLCMQYTLISAHSRMPTYYGGPLKHGGLATVVTRRFRLPVPYCFLYLVCALVRDGSRSDSTLVPGPNAHEKKKIALFSDSRCVLTALRLA